MDTDAGYPIGQAITDTSHALAGELGLDTNTVKRVLSPWVLRKVPKEERHDVLQDLACRALRYRPHTPGLLYSVFKGGISDWWKARRYREHESLDVVVEDDEGEGTPLIETLPDDSRPLDDLVCGFVWAKELLSQIPDRVIRAGEKRVMGSPLSAAERQTLSRWRRSHDPLPDLTGD